MTYKSITSALEGYDKCISCSIRDIDKSKPSLITSILFSEHGPSGSRAETEIGCFVQRLSNKQLQFYGDKGSLMTSVLDCLHRAAQIDGVM